MSRIGWAETTESQGSAAIGIPDPDLGQVDGMSLRRRKSYDPMVLRARYKKSPAVIKQRRQETLRQT